jgi:hypothetical protein
VAELIADLGHLVSGVHRVVAAVVEEIADVVGLEDFDQALVLGAILFEALQLVTGRAERSGGRVPERLDRRARLLAHVDEILGERAHDAVAAGVNLGDLFRLHRRFDDAGRRCVDDGRDATRLSIKRVHGLRLLRGGAFHVLLSLSRECLAPASLSRFAWREWFGYCDGPSRGSRFRSRI